VLVTVQVDIGVDVADRPPLRQFLMDGEFFVGAALATTLTKLALRYVAQTTDKRKQNVCFSPSVF